MFIKGTRQSWKLGVGTSAELYKQRFDSVTARRTESEDRVIVKEKSSLVKRADGWKIGLVLIILVIGLVVWRMGRRFFFF